jgi:hypothetical protein
MDPSGLLFKLKFNGHSLTSQEPSSSLVGTPKRLLRDKARIILCWQGREVDSSSLASAISPLMRIEKKSQNRIKFKQVS